MKQKNKSSTKGLLSEKIKRKRKGEQLTNQYPVPLYKL